MLFQKVTGQISLFSFLAIVASASAFADSPVTNSDMMMSGPSSAAPIRLTIKHPKNTAMHVTIVTGANGSVDLNAPVNDAPTIAYAFPLDAVRNVKVYDGAGQEVWRLISGEVFTAPVEADVASSRAFLTDLYRQSAADRSTVQGFYALKISAGSESEFVSTTDMARIDTAGTPRRWAHHRPSADNGAMTETTIVISPSAYDSALSSRRAPTQ